MVLSNASSNAVSQFEAWSQEEHSLRASAAKADRERARVEERLRQLRLQQKQLSTDTREASDTLGRFHRERGLLQQQKDRLEQQLKEERVMLEQCAKDTENLAAHDMANKKSFCKESEALNNELSALLMQQEDMQLQQLVSTPESVVALRECFCQLDGGANVTDLDAAIEVFMTANTKYENESKERETLEKDIEAFRARALQQASANGNHTLTKESLQQLERVWGEQGDGALQQASEPAHLQLFYAEGE